MIWKTSDHKRNSKFIVKLAIYLMCCFIDSFLAAKSIYKALSYYSHRISLPIDSIQYFTDAIKNSLHSGDNSYLDGEALNESKYIWTACVIYKTFTYCLSIATTYVEMFGHPSKEIYCRLYVCWLDWYINILISHCYIRNVQFIDWMIIIQIEL